MHKGDFDVEILRDLINEGYEGQELLEKFIAFREQVPVAFKNMMNDMFEKYKEKTYTLEEILNDNDCDE